MAITLTLKVTIDSFAAEATARGNFGARGITAEVIDVKGCEASQLSVWTPMEGNGGNVSFLTKDVGLVAKVNKAREARMSPRDEIAALKAEIAALKAAKEGKARGAKKAPTEAELLMAELAALKAGK
jgi:hypothetical protein